MSDIVRKAMTMRNGQNQYHDNTLLDIFWSKFQILLKHCNEIHNLDEKNTTNKNR